MELSYVWNVDSKKCSSGKKPASLDSEREQRASQVPRCCLNMGGQYPAAGFPELHCSNQRLVKILVVFDLFLDRNSRQ